MMHGVPQATCTADGCNKPGNWFPVILMKVNSKSPPIRASLRPLVRCAEHKESTDLAQVLSDEGWDRLMRHMASRGKESPSRSLTTLTFEAVSAS
jgi:uncharacterized protein (DUF2336 family)